MASLSEKEKNKLIQEKCQTILCDLLKDEDNKYCVDCDAKSPRWASWNLGIFLCIRCAGIHRNLGVHISRVKSVNLDSWTPQQVACIQQMGNSRARAVYEANIPDSFRRPQMDSALEQFVKAKYEDKKYIAKEWVQPPMPNPTWDLELEKQLRKKKREKTSGGTVELPTPINTRGSRGNSASPKPLPKAPGSKGASPSPAVKSATSTSSSSSVTQDLLGLDAVSSGGGGGGGGSNSSSGGNIDAGDPFGEFLAAPGSQPTTTTTTQPATTQPPQPPQQQPDTTRTEEENFFNQKLPDNFAGQNKMTKDSILALYGQTPPPPPPAAHAPGMFGMPGSVYMPHGHAPQSLPQMPQIPQSMAQIPQSVGQIPQSVAQIPQSIAQIPQSMPQIPQSMPQCMPQISPVPQSMSQMPQSGLQNGIMSQPSQNNMLFMSQAGMGSVAGIPNPFYPNGLTQQNPASIQLSAANPFAQMQNQMTNLNLGNQPRAAPPGQGGYVAPPQPMVGALGMGGLTGGISGGLGMSEGMTAGAGFNAAPNNTTTLATKLWQ